MITIQENENEKCMNILKYVGCILETFSTLKVLYKSLKKLILKENERN